MGFPARIAWVLLIACTAAAPAQAQTGTADSDNAAPLYLQAAERLALTAEERALLEPLADIDKATGPEVLALADRAGEALDGFREAARAPRCDFQLAYERGMAMPMDHLAGIRPMVKLACIRAREAMKAGRWEEAAGLVSACYRAGGHLGEDHVLLSHLVQSSVIRWASETFEFSFAYGPPPEAFLGSIRAATAGLRIDFTRAVRYEVWSFALATRWFQRAAPRRVCAQAGLEDVLKALEEGREPSAADVRNAAEKWGIPEARVKGFRDGAAIKEFLLGAERGAEGLAAGAIEAWGSPPDRAPIRLKAIADEMAKAHPWPARMWANLVDTWRKERETRARLAVDRLVLDLFDHRKGRGTIPGDLAELTKFLGGRLPEDLTAGRTLEYRLDDRAVVIRSVVHAGDGSVEDEFSTRVWGLDGVDGQGVWRGAALFWGTIAGWGLIAVLAGIHRARHRADWALRGNPLFDREVGRRDLLRLLMTLAGGLAAAIVVVEVPKEAYFLSYLLCCVLGLAGPPLLVVPCILTERERGTADSLVASDFPRTAMIRGILAGRFGPLALACVAAALAGFVRLVLPWLHQGLPMNTSGWVFPIFWANLLFFAVLASVAASLAFGARRRTVAGGIAVSVLAIAAVVVLAALVTLGLMFLEKSRTVPGVYLSLTAALSGGTFLLLAGARWALLRAAAGLDSSHE